MKRIRYFDIAKAVGIAAIIYGHTNEWMYLKVMSFHVPLFFVISGYFLSTKRPVREYIRGKADELLRPYFLTGMVLIVLSGIKGMMEEGASTGLLWANDTLLSVLYGSGTREIRGDINIYCVGAIWFLFALFWSMVIVRLSMEKKNGWIYVAVFVILGMVVSEYVWLPFSLLAGMVCAGYVYIGFLAKKYQRHYSNVMDKLGNGGMAILCILLCVVWQIYVRCFSGCIACAENKYENGIIDGVGSIIAVWFIIVFSRVVLDRMPLVGEICSWIGQRTLQILCIHMIDLRFGEWEWLRLRIPCRESIQFLCVAICQMCVYCSIIFLWDKMREYGSRSKISWK